MAERVPGGNQTAKVPPPRREDMYKARIPVTGPRLFHFEALRLRQEFSLTGIPLGSLREMPQRIFTVVLFEPRK